MVVNQLNPLFSQVVNLLFIVNSSLVVNHFHIIINLLASLNLTINSMILFISEIFFNTFI